jgi:Ca2+-binding RTX toxin-like protein
VACALGVGTGLLVAEGGAARGTTVPPCQANGHATTITTKTYTGGNGPETIQANDKDNVIFGRGGNDVICGYIGKDRLDGGKGRDDLWGEDQADKLFGGSQADKLRGGSADDVCKGGEPKASGGPDPDRGNDCETLKGASHF